MKVKGCEGSLEEASGKVSSLREIWQQLPQRKMHLLLSPAIPLLGIYLQTDLYMWTRIFIAAEC